VSLDPITATEAIQDSYFRYIATTFRLRDPDLHEQLERSLKASGKFTKGPILEATPPFQSGACIEDLVKEGVLSPLFRRLCSDNFPGDRPLFVHQERAVRKIVTHGRNVVVATGTGSGKTETFLIPVLNFLFRQQESGQLGPGVRALLLYPMNALANDQIARLEGLLKSVPEITFGRYTGETAEKTGKAIDLYRKMYGRDPLPNELVSREQMRASPPHILLTNYAMLEYLLLRPDDHVFFDGALARNWAFLVLDEAHTYTGAKGIEMAMLLRRLKDRVVDGESGRLRCIATSATLGDDAADWQGVARFASRLFGETFEWHDSDPQRQDVVQAVRKRSEPSSEST